jgi:hypothetical protein
MKNNRIITENSLKEEQTMNQYPSMKISSAIRDYIRTLHFVNADFIKVAAFDAIRNNDEDYLISKLSSNLMRLLPIKSNKKRKIIELDYSAGLLEFNDEYPFLDSGFKDIINNNYDLVNNLRIIRNKYQHKLHGIVHKSTGSGSSSLLTITIIVDGKEHEISCDQILNVIEELNNIYGKLLSLVIEKYYIEPFPNLYFENLKRFDFIEYNKVLRSNNLKSIGKIFHDFF